MKQGLVTAARLSFVAAALALSPPAAEAASFTVLHNFTGYQTGDGAQPTSGVLPARHGGFYVATREGGPRDEGTLTLIRKDGSAQVLHAFAGADDGANPQATPLLWTDGNLYGTVTNEGPAGCGAVYRYSPASSAYQQLYAFQCAPDGAFPSASLTDTGRGVLVGTTSSGGSNNGGSTFIVRPDGTVGQGCSFDGGAFPYAAITEVPVADEFTVTLEGGSAFDGTIVRFHETCFGTAIHTFMGGSDGAQPSGSLLYYNNALYGTTSGGGVNGLGIVFRVNPDGTNYTVLHTFQGICCGNRDGSFPASGLTLDPKDGMLYGTTIKGGNSSDNGTIFKIDPNTGAEQAIYAFSGRDGAYPHGDLYIKKGKIYGTTANGGTGAQCASGCGTVFRLKT